MAATHTLGVFEEMTESQARVVFAAAATDGAEILWAGRKRAGWPWARRWVWSVGTFRRPEVQAPAVIVYGDPEDVRDSWQVIEGGNA